MLLYTHFYNISLNVLRPNFLNICHLPISHFPNIRKIRVKVWPKTNYFSYVMSSCTDRIVVFNFFFWLIFIESRNKENRARDFLLFKYFFNNLVLTVFMQFLIKFICRVSFEVFDVKQIYSRARKLNIWTPFFVSFFWWNEINKKSPIKEDTRKIKNCKAIKEDATKMENYKTNNIPEKRFLQELLEVG